MQSRLKKEIPIFYAISIVFMMLSVFFVVAGKVSAEVLYDVPQIAGASNTYQSGYEESFFILGTYSDCSEIPDWSIDSIELMTRTNTGTYDFRGFVSTGNSVDTSLHNKTYGDSVSVSTTEQVYTFPMNGINVKDVCQGYLNNVTYGENFIQIGVDRVTTGSAKFYYYTSEQYGGTEMYMRQGMSTWDLGGMVINGSSGGEVVTYENSITLVSPINATTTDDTNVDLYLDYYNDGTYDTVSWEGFYESNNFNGAFFSTTTASVGLIVGDTINVDLDTNSLVLWRAYLGSSATTTNKLYSDFENFAVVSNPYPDLIGVEDWDNTFDLATSTCSIGNISGCFQNAMIFLFKPSTNAFQPIISLKEEIQYKPPFGYFFAIQSAFDLSTTTPAYTLEIPDVMVDLFSPIKTGIAWLLWILFGFWVVRTFAKLQV